MKKLLKWLNRIVLAVVILGLVGGTVLAWLLGRVVTEDGLVAAVEGEITARIEIGELEVGIWQVPARVVLRDVKLAPRDEWVGKPLAERPRLEGVPIEIGEVRVAVGLGALLKRRIEVREFVFDQPRIEMTVFEDGGNSLEPMFQSPEKPERKKKRSSSSKRDSAGALNVHEVGVLAEIEGLAIRTGTARVTIEKSGLVVGVSDWTVELDKIEVDPEALETMNTARLHLAGRLMMDSTNGQRLASLRIDGPAEARLFDPSTGDLAPEIRSDLILGEESYLSARIPAVAEAWHKVRQLANLGLDLGGFPERATFGRSESLAARYEAGRVTLEKPLSMWFGDWELALLEDAWVQTGESTHEVPGELLASQKMSALLEGQLAQALDYLPEEIRLEVVEQVAELWFRDGRLVADLVSTGDLSDPEVDVLNKYPDLKELAKEAGERFAEEHLGDLGGSLLKKLLGEEEDEEE